MCIDVSDTKFSFSIHSIHDSVVGAHEEQDSNVVNSCSAPSPYRRPTEKSISPEAEEPMLSFQRAALLRATAKTANVL